MFGAKLRDVGTLNRYAEGSNQGAFFPWKFGISISTKTNNAVEYPYVVVIERQSWKLVR